MKIQFSTAFAALGCILLASCYPYNENRGRRQAVKPPEKSVSSADQQKIKAQRDKMKSQDDLKKTDDLVETNAPDPTGTTTTNTETTKPSGEEKRTDYAFANKVPGKEGFVFSPYNNKIVDVRDIPSGTLVQDPTYTGAGKGYFRVP